MNYANTILNTIGDTPLIKLNRITQDIDATVLVKNEASNPSHSITDRVITYAIEKAIEQNMLRSGGTIIVSTSANLAISFALASISKGYQLKAIISDKESQEKITMLKALGGEVTVCPNDLKSSDARSKIATAKRLHKRTSNSWLVDENSRASFVIAYQKIAQEIWEQTAGKLTHLIIPITTGAGISGMAQFLKEKNQQIKIWGVDAYGSILKKYFDTGAIDENEVYPYETEGVGASSIVEGLDFSNISGVLKVNDKDSALNTKNLALQEGLFLGNSTGATLGALHLLKDQFTKNDVVVLLAKDGGERYLSKVYNEEWMRSKGFLAKPISVASDLVKDPTADIITVKTSELVSHAVARMRKYKISQIPVVDANGLVGSIDEMSLFSAYLDDHRKADTPISEIMNSPFPIVNSFTSVEEIASLIRKGNTAVIVALDNEKHGIITKSDVISHLQ